MPDFYFRGNLIQYYQAIYAEYLRLTTVLGQEYLILRAASLKTTPPPDYVPKINDEVVFQFLLENKLPVVSIRADTVLGAEMVNVQANIYPEAFEKTGEFSFSCWLEIQNSWLEKGWLISPAAHLSEVAQIGMRPEQLPKPKSALKRVGKQFAPLERRQRKKKHGMHGSTLIALNYLRDIHAEASKSKNPIIPKKDAVKKVTIVLNTWRNNDRELWDHWEDKSYRNQNMQ